MGFPSVVAFLILVLSLLLGAQPLFISHAFGCGEARSQIASGCPSGWLLGVRRNIREPRTHISWQESFDWHMFKLERSD